MRFSFVKNFKPLLLIISIVVIFALMLISVQNKQMKSSFSQEVREKFKQHLIALPEPPFNDGLGHHPSKDEIELGRMLFNDPVLSRNNDVSCATCHLSNHGFADGNRLNFGSLGEGGPSGDTVGKKWGEKTLSTHRSCGDDGSGFHCRDPMFRNSLSTVNVLYRADKKSKGGLLWDGRFHDLKFQVLLPLHTPEEMCGTNPVPLENNIFKSKGILFDQPIQVTHSHYFDSYTGKQLLRFNSPPQWISGIPSQRPNGGFSFPARNECLALVLAKLNKIEWYRDRFKKVYQKEPITDDLIGSALASFVSTHVSNRTPFDQFVQGRDSLSPQQLKGLSMFLSPVGESFTLNGQELQGVGCVDCHSPPHFGGDSFAGMGIRGDIRSSLSRPNIIFGENTGFFPNVLSSHGPLPNCHVLDDTVIIGKAAPDIGRALATFKSSDCFSFRVPSLRNVIETYPYFHHGTETGQRFQKDRQNFKELSLHALQNAIEFHIRGYYSLYQHGRAFWGRGYSDPSFQLDALISSEHVSSIFKEYKNLKLNSEEIKALLHFVAYGLYDPWSVQKGYFGNDLSHPKKVPSGFSPSVTRDHGKQTELAPHGDFEK